jgi:hypothetical protein
MIIIFAYFGLTAIIAYFARKKFGKIAMFISMAVMLIFWHQVIQPAVVCASFENVGLPCKR